MDTVKKSYTALPDVSCREEDDGAVLYNPDIDKAIIINPTGMLIWKHIQEGKTLEEIIQFVSETFDETPTNVKDDIQSFLDSLGNDFIGTDHDTNA